MRAELVIGDCRDIMAAMEPNSIDAIVCDPPYGLEFMGKEWDKLGAIIEHPDDGEGPWGRTNRVRYGSSAKTMQDWHEAWAREALRILKPGGHLVAFGGSRTYHRLACAIEDAGFEIRDQLQWLYGSGFPKSLDVGKAMDKVAGAEREVVGPNRWDGINGRENTNTYGDASRANQTAPATNLARQWDGWGTALKPAHEPIVLARKPLAEKTVAANVTEWGTGAINVDGCRIAGDVPKTTQGASSRIYGGGKGLYPDGLQESTPSPQGRWPANVCMDREAGALLDEMSGERKSKWGKQTKGQAIGKHGIYGTFAESRHEGSNAFIGDTGGASRFFLSVPIDEPDTLRFAYVPKASRAERNAGLEGMPERANRINAPRENEDQKHATLKANHHPTVKPIALMRWLVRLITPPGGVVLDPFLGSGSTGCAAALEGVDFIGCDLDAEYVEIARHRIAHCAEQVERAGPMQATFLEGEA